MFKIFLGYHIFFREALSLLNLQIFRDAIFFSESHGSREMREIGRSSVGDLLRIFFEYENYENFIPHDSRIFSPMFITAAYAIFTVVLAL